VKAWVFLAWLIVVCYIFVGLFHDSRSPMFSLDVSANQIRVYPLQAMEMIITFAAPSLIAAALTETSETLYYKLKKQSSKATSQP